ncbi:MAG: hypothetical protein ACI4LC_06030 [Emergencia sp.]
MSKKEIALDILLSLIEHNQFFSIAGEEDDVEASKKFAKMYNAIYETLCIEE